MCAVGSEDRRGEAACFLNTYQVRLSFHALFSHCDFTIVGMMRRELAHEKEQCLKDAMESQEIRANDAEQHVMEAKYAALQATCVALTKVRDNLLQALMY